MSTDFTKGPWRFVDGETRSIYSADSPDDALMCDETYYPWCPADDDDWHLIAAAPELYEALQALVDAILPPKVYIVSAGPRLQRVDGADLSEVIYKASAALAKAKGQRSD